MELLNKVLDKSSVEANNRWSKIERVRGRGGALIMIYTYTLVVHALGLHLRY